MDLKTAINLIEGLIACDDDEQMIEAETVRQPEPPKKPRKKPAKKKKVGGQSSPGLKRIENILVPGLNPGKNANKNWLAEQRRIWGA